MNWGFYRPTIWPIQITPEIALFGDDYNPLRCSNSISQYSPSPNVPRLPPPFLALSTAYSQRFDSDLRNGVPTQLESKHQRIPANLPTNYSALKTKHNATYIKHSSRMSTGIIARISSSFLIKSRFLSKVAYSCRVSDNLIFLFPRLRGRLPEMQLHRLAA